MESFPTTGKVQCCEGQLLIEKFKPICLPCNGPLNMVLVAILYSWAGEGLCQGLVEFSQSYASVFPVVVKCQPVSLLFSMHPGSTKKAEGQRRPQDWPAGHKTVDSELLWNDPSLTQEKTKTRSLTLLRTGSSCDTVLREVVSQQRPGQMWLI